MPEVAPERKPDVFDEVIASYTTPTFRVSKGGMPLVFDGSAAFPMYPAHVLKGGFDVLVAPFRVLAITKNEWEKFKAEHVRAPINEDEIDHIIQDRISQMTDEELTRELQEQGIDIESIMPELHERIAKAREKARAQAAAQIETQGGAS